ncbi:minor capsid protein [Microbacterium sp. p3-SID131]|uniref:minor capsid protein n=1 Tax=Microbacterium sp. p3-SID131 TaxID=2916215 RepID=UPI0021A6D56D|nr:minor capsid protein [Microbacterium sp. p3-SID131]MCT1363966.1 minor capsid protein [Microbacterium sp. p3-SID131]
MTMDDATLTRLLCRLLARVPTFEYDVTPPSSGVAVQYGALKAEPDRAVGVRVYSTTDERHLHWRRAQVRIRGAKGSKTDADKIAGIVFAALHGLSREGGISGIRRESMSPNGADTNGREERTDNYIITLDNQESSS